MVGGMLPEDDKSVFTNKNTWAGSIIGINIDPAADRIFQLYGKQTNRRK